MVVHVDLSTRDSNLIQRLKARAGTRGDATSNPVPPATPKALQAAERALGFPLPKLLRAIYSTVANGGFGPEYGIVGTRGGFQLNRHSLESWYRELLQLDKDNPLWRWPPRLLPLADYGCGMWACVDCAAERLPMILWDPNNLDATLAGADARLN